MPKLISSVFLLLVFCLNISHAANERLDQRALEVALLCYDLDPNAVKAIENLKAEDPKYPAGYIVEMVRSYWIIKYDHSIEGAREKFLDAADTTIDIAENYLNENPDDVSANFFLSLSKFILTRYHVLEGNTIRGLIAMRSGNKYLKKTLDRDPDFLNAKFVQGMGNCYLDRAPSFLKLFAKLLGKKWDYDKGLKQLVESADKPSLVQFESWFHLADIYYNIDGDKEKAVERASALSDRFPNNPYFAQQAAWMYMELDERSMSLKYLLRAIGSSSIDDFPYMKAVASKDACELLNEEKRYEECVQIAENSIPIFLGKEVYQWIPTWTLVFKMNANHGLGDREKTLLDARQLIEIGSSEDAKNYARSVMTELGVES